MFHRIVLSFVRFSIATTILIIMTLIKILVRFLFVFPSPFFETERDTKCSMFAYALRSPLDKAQPVPPSPLFTYPEQQSIITREWPQPTRVMSVSMMGADNSRKNTYRTNSYGQDKTRVQQNS